MLVYIGRRLLYALLTFIGITIATFALIHSAPGDPVQYYAGRGAITATSASAMAALRHEFHLPGREPWPEDVRPIRFWNPDQFQDVRWGPDGSCIFDNTGGQLP